jgi:hypothetical protein
MTAEYPQGDEPLIPMPALSLPGSAPGGRHGRAVPAAGVLPGNPGRLHPGRRRGQRLPHPPLLPALGRRPAPRPRQPSLTGEVNQPSALGLQPICAIGTRQAW